MKRNHLEVVPTDAFLTDLFSVVLTLDRESRELFIAAANAMADADRGEIVAMRVEEVLRNNYSTRDECHAALRVAIGSI